MWKLNVEKIEIEYILPAWSHLGDNATEYVSFDQRDELKKIRHSIDVWMRYLCKPPTVKLEFDEFGEHTIVTYIVPLLKVRRYRFAIECIFDALKYGYSYHNPEGRYTITIW